MNMGTLLAILIGVFLAIAVLALGTAALNGALNGTWFGLDD